MPEQWQGKRMWAIAGQFAGSQDEAEQMLAPMRALGAGVRPVPADAVHGGAEPDRRREPVRPPQLLAGAQPRDFDDKLTDQLLAQAETMPSPFSALLLVNMAGAIADVGDDDTALGGRSAPFSVHLNTMWEGAENDDANIAWTRGATEAFGPWISPGMALNFYTEVGENEITDSFGARLARLQTVKQKYDPGNLFRLNQNIKPA